MSLPARHLAVLVEELDDQSGLDERRHDLAEAVVPLVVARDLEAWAVDRPVVSTTKGCEGLVCRDGDELLVADRPEAFADAVCRLLDDHALAGRLVRRARHTLLTHYDVRVLPSALAAIVGDEAGQAGGRHAARPVA